MQMTNEEIVRDYNAAKNKQKQVRILADLNQTSPSEILTILAAILHRRIERLRKIRSCMTPRWGHCTITAGVEGVKKPEKIMPRKKPKAEVPWDGQEPVRKARRAAQDNAPEAVQPFWQRMEAILDALPEKLPPEAAGSVQNLLQTLFADYLGQRLEGRVRDDA